MSGTDREPVRLALEAQRRRLLDELGQAIEAPGAMTYGSQAAAATAVFEQQRDLALRDRAAQQLELVDAALGRLEAGTWGVCATCGTGIAPERLEALPWATTCITCQRAAGRRRP